MIRLSVIARAIIVADDKVLLAKHRDHHNTFSPGGHVEPGESCVTTLQRELAEELGIACRVDDYLGAIEHRWWDTDHEIWQHELNHYFAAHSPDLQPGVNPEAIEDHLLFFWSTVEEFERHNLLPVPLRGMIAHWLEGDQTIWWASTL